MMDGFFHSSELGSRRRIPLPPQLIIRPPERKDKPKVNKAPVLPGDQMIMDIECYQNYFLVKFLRVHDDATFIYERLANQELNYNDIEYILDNYEIITFNGNGYDIPILRLALTGAGNTLLKKASDLLIKGHVTPWQFVDKYELPDLCVDFTNGTVRSNSRLRHIDLMPLCPGTVSLKIYGGRLHCEKMQDLPYDEASILTEAEMDDVEEYCGNDLSVTKMVFIELLPQIELRRVMTDQYDIDLMSKSDAQIAEAVITNRLSKIKKGKLEKREVVPGDFFYKAPDFIKFNNPILLRALDITTTRPFEIGSNGRITMPKELLELKVKIGNTIYSMGMGGLHSTEKTAYHLADDNFTLHDWDVTSYYPEIILRCGLYPKQLGPEFLIVYEAIVDERVEAKAEAAIAKKAGDFMKAETFKVKADSFKIVVNGSFGKLGSPYSILYAPELMVQVTVTGQLSLLMLIEMMENKGIPVVSGNTDGIVIKCPKGKEDLMRRIIARWQDITGFNMEESKYLGLYSRDVNNYIAIKTDGEVKTKGCFAPAGINKNPEHEICSLAMIAYLKDGIPLEQTIRECQDVRKFVTVKTVRGGAIKHYDKGILPPHNSKEDLCKMAGFEYCDLGASGWKWVMGGGSGLGYPNFASDIDEAYKYAKNKLAQHDNTVYLGKAIRWYYSRTETGTINYKIDNKKVSETDNARPIMTFSGEFPKDVDHLWYVNKCKELFA